MDHPHIASLQQVMRTSILLGYGPFVKLAARPYARLQTQFTFSNKIQMPCIAIARLSITRGLLKTRQTSLPRLRNLFAKDDGNQ
jgi:hypothetical protein